MNTTLVSGRKWGIGCSILFLGAALGSAVPCAADGPWQYTLGLPRADQQANLCTAETDVAALAKVFEDRGPRPGFAALTASGGCSVRVDTFTPEAIVEQVRIQTRDHNSYVVRFVRVRTAGGVSQYLVTTRNVAAR